MAEMDLRGVVFSKFHNVAEFAKALNWNYMKAYRIVNGKQLPNTTEVREICMAVGLEDPAAIVRLFSLA